MIKVMSSEGFDPDLPTEEEDFVSQDTQPTSLNVNSKALRKEEYPLRRIKKVTSGLNMMAERSNRRVEFCDKRNQTALVPDRTERALGILGDGETSVNQSRYWQEEDYSSFKNSAKQELLNYMKLQGCGVKEAMDVLWQPSLV